MELVERYLQAVRFWLPKRQKHDIIAELSSDIHSQIEDQETALGRSLNEAEIVVVLKQRGRPMLVATQYLPQRYLIGPAIFPMYTLVLKIIFAWCLIAVTVGWISLLIFDSYHRAGETGNAVANRLSSLWLAGLVSAAVLTILFAVLERADAHSRVLDNWDPRKLPSLWRFKLIKRFSSSIELAVNLVFLVWWTANMSSPIVVNHTALRISLSPSWIIFFWGILCVTAVNASLAATNLVRPYWTAFRATLRLLADFAGAALFCWLLKANILAGLSMANVSADRALQITDSVNLWMARMFPAATVVVALIVLADAFRIARLKIPSARLPWEAATI